MPRKFTIEDVREIFASKGCKLLTDFYTNNRQILSFICSCGATADTYVFKFKNSPRCANCAKIHARDKSKATWLERYGVEHIFELEKHKQTFKDNLKADWDNVVATFTSMGYTLISSKDEYINEDTYLDCICPCGSVCKLQYRIAHRGIGSCPVCQRNKIKATCLERYGVESSFQAESVKDKIRATCIERYGVPNPQQNKEVHDRIMKARFKLKEVTLPSGLTVKVQGYEPWYIKKLIADGVSDEDIVRAVKDVDLLNIWYESKGKQHRYYPDFYIKAKNLIIEVKSEYTYKVEEVEVMLKFEACRRDGYKVEIWVYDKSGKVVTTIVSE